MRNLSWPKHFAGKCKTFLEMKIFLGASGHVNGWNFYCMRTCAYIRMLGILKESELILAGMSTVPTIRKYKGKPNTCKQADV